MPSRKVPRTEAMQNADTPAPRREPERYAPSSSTRPPDEATASQVTASQGTQSAQPTNPARRSMHDTLDRDALADLLERVAQGDVQAWNQLVQAFTPRVYGLLYKNCRDGDLAEELTQVTFVKLVQKLDRFEGYEERGRFEPWLFRVALNALRDEMRRRGRQASSIDMSPGAASGSADAPSAWVSAQSHVQAGSPGPSAAEDPLAIAERHEMIVHLQAAVAELPEADREVLHLRHTAGLTFAQIAETLDQPLGTVLARGHRAVKKLRAALESVLEDGHSGD